MLDVTTTGVVVLDGCLLFIFKILVIKLIIIKPTIDPTIVAATDIPTMKTGIQMVSCSVGIVII